MSRNKFKFRREIIAAGGITSTGGIDITAASTFTGAVTFAAAPVFSAGIDAPTFNTPPTFTLGLKHPVVQTIDDNQAVTDTGGTTKAGYAAILGYGITKIGITGTSGTTAGSTANDLVFNLNSPYAVGIDKIIIVSGNTASTKEVRIRTKTSTHVFYGSTKNQITFSTLVYDYPASVHLVGISTVQWAVLSPMIYASTATAAPWSLVGATGQ